MDSLLSSGLHILGQPIMGSVYDEQGTAESGYEEKGPYHCEDCIHKTAKDEPFCVHPKVIADPALQDRLVMINNRPAIKINLEHGCCSYVNQPLCEDEDDDHAEHS
jgi:hypothetical protein